MNILKTFCPDTKAKQVYVVNRVTNRVELVDTQNGKTFSVSKERFEQMKHLGKVAQYDPELPGQCKNFDQWTLTELQQLRSDRVVSFELHVKGKKETQKKKTVAKKKKATAKRKLKGVKTTPPPQVWENIKNQPKTIRDQILKSMNCVEPTQSERDLV